jgi:hypothetical protein
MTDSTVDGVLRNLQDRISNISQHGDAQDQNLSNNTPFDTSSTKNELENDLQQMQQAIQQLSKFCLNKMTTSSTSLHRLEVDLGQVEGSLKTIRSNAGRQLVTPPLPSPAARSADSSFLPGTTKANVTFPSYDFELNTGALEGVGRQAEDDDTGAPLIIKLESGVGQPLLWSKTNDFFLPAKPTSSFATSFSEFYGFDGAICFTAKERSTKVLAQKPPQTQGHGKAHHAPKRIKSQGG